jgi:hypothetical protein
VVYVIPVVSQLPVVSHPPVILYVFTHNLGFPVSPLNLIERAFEAESSNGLVSVSPVMVTLQLHEQLQEQFEDVVDDWG